MGDDSQLHRPRHVTRALPALLAELPEDFAEQMEGLEEFSQEESTLPPPPPGTVNAVRYFAPLSPLPSCPPSF